MSHYSRIAKTKLVERAHLVKALEDLGFSSIDADDQMKPVGPGAGQLVLAEIVARGGATPGRYPVGFRKGPDGHYDLLVDDLDRNVYDDAWLRKLRQRYNYHAAIHHLTLQGFANLQEEVDQDGTVRLLMWRLA